MRRQGASLEGTSFARLFPAQRPRQRRYFGNLHPYVAQKSLEDLCSYFGAVEQAKVIKVRWRAQGQPGTRYPLGLPVLPTPGKPALTAGTRARQRTSTLWAVTLHVQLRVAEPLRACPIPPAGASSRLVTPGS